MNIVIFCDSKRDYLYLFNELKTRILDIEKFRIRHNGTFLENVDKDIEIHIRYANKEKSAGLRPDYVLLYTSSCDFIDYWRFNMHNRYVELESLNDLINLVNNIIQNDLITRYVETVLDIPLLEYQKKMLEACTKMPPNTKMIMDRNGKIHFESRTEKKVEE